MRHYIFLVCLFMLPVVAMAQCLPNYQFSIKRIDINNSKISYIDEGSGETILFLHGLGGNAAHWKKNIQSLSKKFRCIAIDLPGYGGSDFIFKPADTLQLTTYTNTIASFIKKLQLSKVVLAGHSMGAQIAILAALQHPSLFTKLLLIAPAGFETFTNTEALLLKKFASPDFYKKQDSVAIANAFRMNFYQVPEGMDQLIQERLKLKTCEAFDNYCKNISLGVQGMLHEKVSDKLDQLTIQTLVIFGDKDALIPNRILHPTLTTANIAAATQNIKNAQLVVIPEAGHLVQFEKSSEVNTIITQFLTAKRLFP
jgi:pimeloyl-ACP methyl ester carboxylesterase